MANRFWKNLGGAVVNSALPGTPYNQYTGQYGRQAMRSSLISGAAGQLVPGGGAIAQMVQNRQPGMQAWNAGLSGWKGMDKQLSDFKVETPQQAISVPNMQMSGFPQMSQPQQSFEQPEMEAPQQGGWQNSYQAPSVSQGGLGGFMQSAAQPTQQSQPQESFGIEVPNAIGKIGFSRGQLQPNLASGGGLSNYMTSTQARNDRSSARHAARGGGTMGFAHADRDAAMPQYKYARL